MNLTAKFKGYSGVDYIFEYSDADSFDNLEKTKCTQIYGVCFYDGKIVIVFNSIKKTWGLAGGTIEKGESFEETLKREILEESNMEVISFLPIGYQKVTKKDGSFKYQLRYVCKVRPYGPFISDPADGIISEIKLIDPSEYKKYVNWGRIGDRLVARSLELLEKLSDN
jgi:8-oxo-dGTP pyrophosphatase MutT (NUDIX family)